MAKASLLELGPTATNMISQKMVEYKNKEVAEYDEIIYDMDPNEPKVATGGQGVTSIHSTSFKDFLLKEELQRAITDCGFELPSHV